MEVEAADDDDDEEEVDDDDDDDEDEPVGEPRSDDERVDRVGLG